MIKNWQPDSYPQLTIKAEDSAVDSDNSLAEINRPDDKTAFRRSSSLTRPPRVTPIDQFPMVRLLCSICSWETADPRFIALLEVLNSLRARGRSLSIRKRLTFALGSHRYVPTLMSAYTTTKLSDRTCSLATAPFASSLRLLANCFEGVWHLRFLAVEALRIRGLQHSSEP